MASAPDAPGVSMGMCPHYGRSPILGTGAGFCMRGGAIPELREQLFAATERILARDGAAGVTSRAITDEAGCAKGVLHNPFDGLDGFPAVFATDPGRQT